MSHDSEFAILQHALAIAEHSARASSIEKILAAEVRRLSEDNEKLKKSVIIWTKGEPPRFMRDERFIAKLKDGSTAVLYFLPDEYSHKYRTADMTYYTGEWVAAWAQFPSSEFYSPTELLERLEQDAKRLDWLEANSGGIEHHDPDDDRSYFCAGNYSFRITGCGETIREAIDAVISAAMKGTT